MISNAKQGKFWVDAGRRSKVLAVLLVVVLAYLGIASLIQLAAVQMVEGESAERSKAVNDARGSLIQLLGLIGLVGGFVYTARTFALTRSTQRADRFVKAIGHIGDQDSEAIRVGGVHSLGLLTMEDRRYWPVVEQILSALIRERAKAGRPSTADIGAALIVIGSRPEPGSDLHKPLDLRGAHLRGMNLVGANLEGAWLDRAVLAEANLTDAVLINARLTGANLSRAILSSANLSAADLSEAQLQGTNLYETRMTDSVVTGADFSGALNLKDSQMQETSGKPASLP
ncbi:UNVERIFIED_ORG: hypothetical protein J2X79_004294 [Arthrobacter globiformis]|nr:hypothetical protein [Arthrobacter globiformis]